MTGVKNRFCLGMGTRGRGRATGKRGRKVNMFKELIYFCENETC
jgi:hypothetical protein